ncbi:deoxycytidylate deaminase [Spiroplasma gladiatoris]|uniref:Deoxycytidylate deaminase n=1 Tax=Spiroplasma gladiatoris TaxID=2143 RepID=A0A4P7AI42_9MOLU|nr:dCMP deaminase family protein [Spiroplasma gladiatoris]QBQ07927.1 deoxycytidylate deaminase [Spiroplasma gladiatoris]
MESIHLYKIMKKRNNYIDWDTYFLAMVELNAMRSKDPNTQVGAVVVNDLKHIIASGYNGLPRGLNDDDFPWSREGKWEETKYPYVVHAEANAILSATFSVRGCTMYTSQFPCYECAKTIVQAGITKVIYSDNKYKDTIQNQVSKKILTTAKVDLVYKKAIKVIIE